uniref:Beta-glucuronidase n=1 Tax=Caenorhabditis japonica TaxID=281687 RepID=A0A8R1IUG5_CAEJA
MLNSWVLPLLLFTTVTPLLYVQKNEIRSVDTLDGLWTFVREPHNGGDVGIVNGWKGKDLAKFENSTVMPVPSSYNDLGTSSELRDHIGWVWYQKKEFIPLRDSNMRHVLRFGSVNYFAVVVSEPTD